ncbi:MAG: CaiB/BaiF CoA-transferase family protein [Candidatus Eremiobacterota bacterium]
MTPLQGLTVVDLTRLLPGPYATWLLADLGARVVKVESPTAPDYLRFLSADVDGNHAGFATLNRNKESLVVRYETPEGSDVVRRLAAKADVFLESNRPGVLERFGLDHTALSDLNPRLIYASLSGYGQHGPMARRAGHDINFLSLTGAGHALGARVLPIQLADLTGGMLTVVAVLAALQERHRTGRGRHLDVSLADGAFAWSALGLTRQLAGLEPEPDLLAGTSPGYRYYRCQDGRWLSVGGLEGKFQVRLQAVLGDDFEGEWPEDVFHCTDPEVHARLEHAFARRPLQEWLQRTEPADACIEPVLEPAEVVQQAWLRQRGLVRTVTGMEGPVEQPGGPLDPAFGASGGFLAPPPGAHTSAILEELGYSAEERARLVGQGVAVPAEA